MPSKEGLRITDIPQRWKAGRAGWMRKLLHMEYNEPKKAELNSIPAPNTTQNQVPGPNAQNRENTEDWLKMLINEIIIILGDLSLSPRKIIKTWGSQKIRETGFKLEYKF